MFFSFNNASCIVSNSSKTNLSRALLKSENSCGKCILSIVLFISHKLFSFNIYSGSVSGNWPFTSANPFSIILLNVFCFSSYVNGFIGSAVSLYKPIQSSTGSTGALGLFVYPPKLFSKFQLPVDDDISHHGRPLCQVRKPSALGGYMLIQDADISINGTSNELSKIRSYLEGGFYYE